MRVSLLDEEYVGKKMNFPSLEAISKKLINFDLSYLNISEKKTYRLQMYLLVTSTTGFRTGIDCSERVADAVVDQAGAVPSMILTGFY